MKKVLKLCLAVLALGVLLFAGDISEVKAEDARGSSFYGMNWTMDHILKEHNYKYVEIEKGAEFYISDFIEIDEENKPRNASFYSKVKYSSDNKKVITVSSKGYLKAKKTGYSTVKARYRGKTIKLKFKVVKKGTFTNTQAVQDAQKAVDKLISVIPKKVTKNNVLRCQKAMQAYYNKIDQLNENALDMEYDGFLRIPSESYQSNRLAFPKAGRVSYMRELIWQYGLKNTPFTPIKSTLKVASVSSKNRQIIIKLKKPITRQQILGANVYFEYNNPKPNDKTAVVDFTICDVKTYQYYSAVVTIKSGSRIITVKNIYGNGSNKPMKPKKGRVYRIGETYFGSGWGKEVKVK